MSPVIPLVSPLIAGLTAAPGGSSLPQVPPPHPPDPAVLTITQIGPQEAGGNVPVSYSIDKTDTGVAAVLYATAEAPPLAADFNGAGAPTYADLGTVTLDTSGTPLDLALPDELNGIYSLALLPSGGGDGDVAVSAPVTIDTTVAAPPPPDPMANDAGVIYWYAADDTTRSGTNVTAVTDKGGNAFDLTSTPAAFTAPQQTDASSPVVFTATGPTIIQTPSKLASNRLMQQHLISGGSLRVFIVANLSTIQGAYCAILAECDSNQSNHSTLFGLGVSNGNLRFYSISKSSAVGMSCSYETAIPVAGKGQAIIEYLVTQSGWTTFLNGVQNSTGSLNPAYWPTAATMRTSLGGRASSTLSADNATCDWREVAVTATVNDSHADSVRVQLAAKHSITL